MNYISPVYKGVYTSSIPKKRNAEFRVINHELYKLIRTSRGYRGSMKIYKTTLHILKNGVFKFIRELNSFEYIYSDNYALKYSNDLLTKYIGIDITNIPGISNVLGVFPYDIENNRLNCTSIALSDNYIQFPDFVKTFRFIMNPSGVNEFSKLYSVFKYSGLVVLNCPIYNIKIYTNVVGKFESYEDITIRCYC